MRNIILISLSLILFAACEKDKAIPIEGDPECYDFEFPTGYSVFPYIYSQYSFQSPCYNPNNSDEICYLKLTQNPYAAELRKHNFATNEDMLLASPMWGKPYWSTSGWILFNKGDNQIWKIKSNGDSLTQLSDPMQGSYFSASWNEAGEKIAYRKHGTSGYLSIVTNQSLMPLDTIEGYTIVGGTWHGNMLAFGNTLNGNVSFVIYNSDTKETIEINTNLHNTGKGENVKGLVWLSSNELMWNNNFGVYITKVSSGQTEELRKLCTSKILFVSSLSPEADRVLMEKVIYEVLDGSAIFTTAMISTTDLKAKNEIDLLKP